MTRNFFLIFAVLLFASTTAMAEGFYGGAGFGLTQIEDEGPGFSYEDNPFGWRILAGYDFNDKFAIEGSYVNSGEAEDDILGGNVKSELSAFTVSIIGLIAVSDSASIFGKLGFYTGEQEIKLQGATLDEDEDGLTAGAGVRFDMGNNFVIRGDFDWYDTDLDALWSVGVGFQYYFGN